MIQQIGRVAIRTHNNNFNMIMSKEERMEMAMGLINECATKEGASKADIDSVLKRQMPSSPQGKCIAACIGETIGTLKNNKLDIEASLSLVKMAYDGDAAILDLTREITTACADVTDADRCVAAKKIYECTKAYAASKGIDVDGEM